MAEQTLVWEGELTAGQSVLVLGATGTSGRIAAQGPYDLIIDYLWGAPAEAVFTALIHPDGRADHAPHRQRSWWTGPTRGCRGRLPRPAPAGRRRRDHARHRPHTLTQVEKTWRQAGSDRRIVFVP
jgi:hypothetical protein